MKHLNVVQNIFRNFTLFMVLGTDIISTCGLSVASKSGECYRKCFTLLQKCCQKLSLSLEIGTIHLDFEERMHTVMREMFPEVVIKSCRLHLGQTWWRKIQNLDLAKEYKNYGSVISK